MDFGGSRGQSATLGVALLLGMTVISVGLIVVTGGQAIDAVRDQVGARQAENVGDEFSETVIGVARGGADETRARTFDTGGTPLEVYPSRGKIRVSNETGKNIISKPLGTAIIGDQDGQRVVIQGGGVLDTSGEEAVMRAGPQISVRQIPSGGLSLSMDLVRITGTQENGDTVRISQGSVSRLFPTGDRSNPVQSGQFTVTVTSEYYLAWGRYFERTFNVDPAYSPSSSSVSVTFVSENAGSDVSSAVVAGAPNSELVLTGGMSMDSYNSSKSPYVSGNNDGRIVTAGDVRVQGGGELRGSLVAAGNVSLTGGGNISNGLTTGGNLTVTGGSVLSGPVEVGRDLEVTSEIGEDSESNVWVDRDVYVDYGATVNGNLTYGGQLYKPQYMSFDAGEQGPVAVSVNIPDPAPVDDLVNSTINTTASNGNDTALTNISGGNLDCERRADTDGDGSDDTCTVGAGSYYVDSIGTGDDLVLNATEGDITLAVDGDVYLDGDADITVVGDGRVNLYTTGNYTQTGGATVTNAGDNAPQFWLYVRSDNAVSLANNEFVGVVYGPGNDGVANEERHAGATIDVDGGVDVYGALVGDITLASSGVGIHYDSALANEKAVPLPEGSVQVAYLHIYESTAEVTAA